MASEQYVRPPLVGREAPSPTVARWRYRLVLGALLLLALVLLTFVLVQLSGVTGGENPGIGSLPHPRSGILSTARVPLG